MFLSPEDLVRSFAYINMRRPYIYKVSVEDATRLHTLLDFKIRRVWLWCGAVIISALLMVAGYSLGRARIAAHPVSSPDKDSAIDAVMTLDSLKDEAERNNAYMRSIIASLDPNRNPLTDSLAVASRSLSYSVDALMEKSDAERAFVAAAGEQERYNVSVLAPLQAEDVEFFNICPEGIQSTESMGKELAEYYIPARATVNAPSECRVVDIYYSPAEGGNVIILQQPRGFLLRLGRLGTVLVKRGDKVSGGEAVAYGNAISGRHKGRITAEMWHNGNRLVPDSYLNKPVETPAQAPETDKLN